MGLFSSRSAQTTSEISSFGPEIRRQVSEVVSDARDQAASGALNWDTFKDDLLETAERLIPSRVSARIQTMVLDRVEDYIAAAGIDYDKAVQRGKDGDRILSSLERQILKALDQIERKELAH